LSCSATMPWTQELFTRLSSGGGGGRGKMRWNGRGNVP
jgi:hypothetical protein